MHPLIVDLDGTLIHTDMLQESVFRVMSENPLNVVRLPSWFCCGRALLKQRLAKLTDFDPSTLPYNHALIDWLKAERVEGRRLILCTGSDYSIALKIADYLGIFDDVMASDGSINLVGKNKAKALEQRFGETGFDYVGNSHADLPVWQSARRAVVVNASANLLKKAILCCTIERIFPKAAVNIKSWCRVLRLHQWMKNALLFVPFIASHQLTQTASWLSLVLAFFSFSLCASSVYIANDLLDLESDRRHVRKRQRPFAIGLVPAWQGLVLAPVLLIVSFLFAMRVGGNFLPWLMVYFVLTCAYSFGFKRLVLIDCLILAVLYTLRLIAGTAAVNMPLSFWLLAFSIFLFSSLAFVKRYAELQMQLLQTQKKIHGRGYYTNDAPLVQMLGIASGYASVLVLALYLNSDVVIKLYRTPECIWGAVPVLLFWISWVWLQAHRGKMHDDPLIFAVKDKMSLLTGVIFVGCLILGAVGWP